MEPRCRRMLDCFAECDDPRSNRRNVSLSKYYYVQHPHDPALCRYGCLELATSRAGNDIIDCVGSSGCMEAAKYSDECAALEHANVLPFSAISDKVWEGKWIKLFTNGWDTWPCQGTELFSPGRTNPVPRGWMKSWPQSPGVWRMDLNWTVKADGDEQESMFSMSSEMYPKARWHYPGGTEANPTLKTIACMWGTEAHENWYLLHYDSAHSWILMHVCAYTHAVQSYDALTLAFVKEGQPAGKEIEDMIQATSQKILGKKFGTLQRIPSCLLETNGTTQ